jgi:hypothetical protein
MRIWFLRTASIIALLASSVTVSLAQKVEFSADMRLLDDAGKTESVKLYVGNQKARIDRDTGGESNGITSMVVDFYNQNLYLLIPQSKMYLRVAGSNGMPFYEAAWMFRPSSSDHPCSEWVAQADRRGITLRCQRAGEDSVDGRSAQKWEATSPEGAHGTLWYDENLNFVVKVMRTSKKGVESGYELQHIKQGPQPAGLFDPHADYHEFSLNKLIDVLTGVGQW